MKEGLITKLEEDNNILYVLNEEHYFYSVLEQFFIIEINNRILREAKTYYQKAQEVLAFVNAANILFKKVKRKGK